jgi:hypothetical protein
VIECSMHGRVERGSSLLKILGRPPKDELKMFHSHEAYLLSCYGLEEKNAKGRRRSREWVVMEMDRQRWEWMKRSVKEIENTNHAPSPQKRLC